MRRILQTLGAEGFATALYDFAVRNLPGRGRGIHTDFVQRAQRPALLALTESWNVEVLSALEVPLCVDSVISQITKQVIGAALLAGRYESVYGSRGRSSDHYLRGKSPLTAQRFRKWLRLSTLTRRSI